MTQVAGAVRIPRMQVGALSKPMRLVGYGLRGLLATFVVLAIQVFLVDAFGVTASLSKLILCMLLMGVFVTAFAYNRYTAMGGGGLLLLGFLALLRWDRRFYRTALRAFFELFDSIVRHLNEACGYSLGEINSRMVGAKTLSDESYCLLALLMIGGVLLLLSTLLLLRRSYTAVPSFVIWALCGTAFGLGIATDSVRGLVFLFAAYCGLRGMRLHDRHLSDRGEEKQRTAGGGYLGVFFCLLAILLMLLPLAGDRAFPEVSAYTATKEAAIRGVARMSIWTEEQVAKILSGLDEEQLASVAADRWDSLGDQNPGLDLANKFKVMNVRTKQQVESLYLRSTVRASCTDTKWMAAPDFEVADFFAESLIHQYLQLQPYPLFTTTNVSVDMVINTGREIYLPSAYFASYGLYSFDGTEAAPFDYTVGGDGVVTRTDFSGTPVDYSAAAFVRTGTDELLARSVVYYRMLRDHIYRYKDATTASAKQNATAVLEQTMTGAGFVPYEINFAKTSLLQFFDLSTEERNEYIEQNFTFAKKYQDFVYANYLDVPDSVHVARAIATIREEMGVSASYDLTADVTKTVNAVIHYFKEHYTYSLTPKDPSDSSLSATDAFLYDTYEGFCQHFARGAALILREMGIPTRYVNGFLATDFYYTTDGDYFTAVESHRAHAWIEVYYDEIGWLTFEPTPPATLDHTDIPLPDDGDGSMTLPSDGDLTLPSDGSLTIPSDGSFTIPSDGSFTIPSDGSLSEPSSDSSTGDPSSDSSLEPDSDSAGSLDEPSSDGSGDAPSSDSGGGLDEPKPDPSPFDGGSLGLPDGYTPEQLAGMVLLSVKASSAGRVYLRNGSAGDYTGTGWMTAPVYDQLLDDQFSMNYLPGIGLADAGMVRREITIDSRLGAILLPYYLSMDANDYTVQTEDGTFTGTATAPYSVYYYLPDDTGFSPVGSTYAAAEQAYRTFVYDNYLSVPADTLAYLEQVIAEQNLTKTDADILQKVASYLSSVATYSFTYDRELDAAEDIVVAFLSQYKEGICQHYASAATLLFRALGIPARYTTGFTTTTRIFQWVDVTAVEAHAWVEVYLDGIGWVQVEVTEVDGIEYPEPDIDTSTSDSTGDSDLSEPSSDDSDLSEPSSDDSDLSEPSSDDSDLSEPSSGDSDLSEPSSDDSDLSEPSSDDSNLSEPSSDDSDLSEPSSDDSDLSEPSSDDSDLSEPSSDDSDLSEPSSDDSDLSEPSDTTTSVETDEFGNPILGSGTDGDGSNATESDESSTDPDGGAAGGTTGDGGEPPAISGGQLGVTLGVFGAGVALLAVAAVLFYLAKRAAAQKRAILEGFTDEMPREEAKARAGAVVDLLLSVLGTQGLEIGYGELPRTYAKRVDKVLDGPSMTEMVGLLEKQEFGYGVGAPEAVKLASYTAEVWDHIKSKTPFFKRAYLHYIRRTL